MTDERMIELAEENIEIAASRYIEVCCDPSMFNPDCSEINEARRKLVLAEAILFDMKSAVKAAKDLEDK